MRAMILAAGFGTRLWPLTIGRTKPAIPFFNRPLISYTIDYLRRHGIKDLIINLHHEPASVLEQIGDGSRYGVRIMYSIEEPEILGPAGALDRVREILERETFVVINGKIITDLDLHAAMATHRERQALATLVLRPNPRRERFSEVKIDAQGNITEFAGFPKPEDPQSNSTHYARRNPTPPLMFTGIHIMEPGIFDYIPRGIFSDSVRDVYPRMMTEGKTLAAHVAEGEWHELSTLPRYLSVSIEFMRREGRAYIADEGCQVESGAEIRDSVLWQRVCVERGAHLTECIVGDGVRIPAGTEFRRAAIVRAELAAASERPEKAAPGRVIGDNLVVPFEG
jgi:NDP-sugar pyrophosphorylase family protein